MNIILDIDAGGVFSKLMFVVQNLSNLTYDNAYLNCVDSRANCFGNPFDYVFQQPSFDWDECERIVARGYCTHTHLDPIENAFLFGKYKDIIKQYPFTDEMQNYIDQYKNLISTPTIGIHVRMTDMHIEHPKHGIYTIDHYLKIVEYYSSLTEWEDSNIFVASDNKESIYRFVDKFGDRVRYVDNLMRAESANENSIKMQLLNFPTKKWWMEAFLEMYLLSMCNLLICRSSNLTNVSKIYSNGTQEWVWMPPDGAIFWQELFAYN